MAVRLETHTVGFSRDRVSVRRKGVLPSPTLEGRHNAFQFVDGRLGQFTEAFAEVVRVMSQRRQCFDAQRQAWVELHPDFAVDAIEEVH